VAFPINGVWNFFYQDNSVELAYAVNYLSFFITR